jgi:hypothetical protein
VPALEAPRRVTLLISVVWPVSAALAAPITIQLPYGDFGHLANAGGQRCVATALMNSFVFLKRRHPGVLGGTRITTGSKATNTLEDARDELAGRMGCDPRERAWWEGKVRWLEEFAGGKVFVAGMEALEDPADWSVAPRPAQAIPTVDFLVRELVRKENVEIGLAFDDAQRHAVTLTSLTFDDRNGNQVFDAGEPPLRIDYLDPDDPSRLHEGPIAIVRGLLRFRFRDGTAATIIVAYSESVPWPGAALLLGAGVLGLAAARTASVRRARRRASRA